MESAPALPLQVDAISDQSTLCDALDSQSNYSPSEEDSDNDDDEESGSGMYISTSYVTSLYY